MGLSMFQFNDNRGFTLVELSVVLVIVGLLISMGLGVSNSQLQATRITNTKQKQEAIRLALISFISQNHRLPCPAVATLVLGSAGYGLEAANPGVCTNTTVNTEISTGIIPWASLGISEDTASDGYYNRFTYQVYREATNRTADNISGLRGAISVHYGTPIAMGSPNVGNQSNNCTPVGGNYNPCSAVAAIISHGTNGFGAYTSNGTRLDLPIGSDELENANDDNALVIKDSSNNTANPFDDYVLALSASNLLTPLTTNGTFKDASARFNDSVNNYKGAVIADAVASRVPDGAGVFYTYALTLTPTVGSTLDPWGNPLIYNVITPIITNLTPGNSVAFTLLSYGPDGVAGGNDDLPRTITVNELQDSFAKAGWGV